MYYETVKTQTKCSHNLWVIKVNKKPDITLSAGRCICNKISIRKPLIDISHIQLFWFLFIVSCKQNINLTEVFHVKPLSSFFIFATRKLWNIQCSHGDIILNWSNNSVFLLQKSIEIGKPLISSAPREFEWSSKRLVTRLLFENVRCINTWNYNRSG